jgi:hypothetical protein
MKKPLLIVIIILVVILAVPFFSFVRWAFQEKKPMYIHIIDKTVPNLERINHKSLTWILTNDRFVKENGSSYSFRKDYRGFVPTRPLRDKLWKITNVRMLTEMMELKDSADVIYFADTYGVFFNDWYKGINKSRRSRKLDGGMTNTDWLFFYEMSKLNKLCILEYNSFDYPTAELERYKVENRLGIDFGGWTGKYFHTLDTAHKDNKDFPIWMTAMYRKKYRQPWNFTKPGIVFLKGSDILVLEEGTHLKDAVPYIVTDSAWVSKYGVSPKVAFNGWFDVIDPMKNVVISQYNLQTTTLGDSILFENFLSAAFPAVVTDTALHRNYYFCGDFAANEVKSWTSKFHGFNKLTSLLHSDKENDPGRFFWHYYKPLVSGILNDYYETAVKTKK